MKEVNQNKTSNINYRDLKIEGQEMTAVVKALSNRIRLKILELLDKQEMNIQSLQRALNMSKTSLLMHIRCLEKAGFISTYYLPGSVGHQKFCKKQYDRLIFNFTQRKEYSGEHSDYYELSITPGNYFNFEVFPPCGLATKENVIIRWDDPSVFFGKERINANIFWCSYGFVEYRIPLNIPFEDLGFSKMEITLELSAQGNIKTHNALVLPDRMSKNQVTDGISDITFWLNNIELGCYQVIDESKTDRQKMGKLTPQWWRGSQYGDLLRIEVNQTGTLINGEKKSNVNLEAILPMKVLKRNLKMKLLLISPDSIIFRIGIKKQAHNKSGFTIYGREFGNYPIDISVMFYK